MLTARGDCGTGISGLKIGGIVGVGMMREWRNILVPDRAGFPNGVKDYKEN